MSRSGTLLRVSAFLVAFIAVACFSSPEPPEGVPAQEYESIEELADALGPLCTEFEDDTQRVKVFEYGRCRTGGFSISVFPDANEYEKHKEDDATGCNGPMVYGPRWNVGPLGSEEIRKVQDAVGGEVVGFSEQGDC